jgi:hypothetical protein
MEPVSRPVDVMGRATCSSPLGQPQKVEVVPLEVSNR